MNIILNFRIMNSGFKIRNHFKKYQNIYKPTQTSNFIKRPLQNLNTSKTMIYDLYCDITSIKSSADFTLSLEEQLFLKKK